MLSVPEFVPEPGDTVNQPALLLAVQAIVPDPAFDTFTLCAAGFDPPAVAETDTAVDDSVSTAGAGATTFRATLIVFGDAVAPAAVIVIAPE